MIWPERLVPPTDAQAASGAIAAAHDDDDGRPGFFP